MNEWEVAYLVEFADGLGRCPEVGWLVVEALFERNARSEAKRIVTECYVSEHNQAEEFWVSVTSCKEV